MLKWHCSWEWLSISQTNLSPSGLAPEKTRHSWERWEIRTGLPCKVGRLKGYGLSRRLGWKEVTYWSKKDKNDPYLHEALNSYYLCWLETPSRRINFKMVWGWGTWVAQLAERPTLDFGSGHDLTVPEIEPFVRLQADSTEPVWDSLSSLSLCPSPAHPLTLSLSK